MTKPVLALFSPNENQLTETFIRAHREMLDADIRLLYGGYRPQFTEQYGALVSQSWIAKVLRRMESIITPASFLTSHERAIVRYLKSENVDVAMAEFGVTGAKVFKACKAANIPLIIHFHGFDAHMYRVVKAYRISYRAMFDYATYIVGVSEYMCDALRSLGADSEKLIYNPYGPNPDFFDCQPALASQNLVAIGRFIPKKNPEMTIRAFAVISKEFPDLRLRMGGEGELLEDCKRLATALGIREKVDLPGPLNHKQVRDWFENALAFVQHSVVAPDGDTEGTPVAILEACAAGLPVVATKHAGIPDVIVNNETGILVEEHDFEAFTAAIRRVVQMPEQDRRKMGENGRNRIKSNFSMEKHINTLNELIYTAFRSKVKNYQ